MTADEVLDALEAQQVPFILTHSGCIRARDIRDLYNMSQVCPLEVLIPADLRDNGHATRHAIRHLGMSRDEALVIIDAADGAFPRSPEQRERVVAARARLRALVVDSPD